MDKKIIGLMLLLIILILFPVVSACYTDAECSNGGAWFTYGDKQVARESCVNGRCQIEDTMYVQCAKDSDCNNGEVCQKSGGPRQWHCIKTTSDSNLQNIPATNKNSSSDSNSVLIASIIIGVCIVVGFIILSIILCKKRK